MPFYSQRPYLYVFIGALAVWAVSDLSVGFRSRGRATASQGRGSKLAIAVAISGGTFGAALLPEVMPAPELPRPPAAFWIGITLWLSPA